MKVIVNRNALIHAIVESLSEEDEPEFERIDVVSDGPIFPAEMMSTQLAEAMPPVDDPDFIPATLEELSRSSFVIAKECPNSQIEFFYRKLHELLDIAADRENERELSLESKIVTESNHSDFEGYEFDPDEDNIGGELSAEELIAQYQQKSSPSNQDLKGEKEEGQRDSDSETEAEPEEEINDDELASEQSEKYYVERAINDFVDILIKKEMHIVSLKDESGKVQTTPTVKMDKGSFVLSDEPMRVLASEKAASKIIQSSLDDSDVEKAFRKIVNLLKSSTDTKPEAVEKVAAYFVIASFSKYLGKEEDPIDPATAAIMAANNMADAFAKTNSVPKFGPEISEIVSSLADDAEKSGSKTVQASSGVGRDIISREVPMEVFVTALRTVSEQRKEKPRRAKRKTYEMESVPTPEELAGIENAKALAEIEKNMKSLTANAETFGYSGAAGLRQWVNKFPLMAWTVLMGEEKGAKAFQGYRSLISEYMLTLLDNFVDVVIPAVKEGIERDSETSEDEKEEIVSLLDGLLKEFEEMRDSALMSDEEEIDPELLLGDFAQGRIGGPVLRNAVNDLFKKEDLMKLSKYVEKELIPHLESEGLSKQAATKLAHMFNGRVKMVNPSELKNVEAGRDGSKSTQNVFNLGIGMSELSKAQKKASEILEEWFNEDASKKRKKAAKEKGSSSKFARDKIKASAEKNLVGISDVKKESERIKFLADLLDNAISSTAKDVEIEVDIETSAIPKQKSKK